MNILVISGLLNEWNLLIFSPPHVVGFPLFSGKERLCDVMQSVRPRPIVSLMCLLRVLRRSPPAKTHSTPRRVLCTPSSFIELSNLGLFLGAVSPCSVATIRSVKKKEFGWNGFSIGSTCFCSGVSSYLTVVETEYEFRYRKEMDEWECYWW